MPFILGYHVTSKHEGNSWRSISQVILKSCGGWLPWTQKISHVFLFHIFFTYEVTNCDYCNIAFILYYLYNFYYQKKKNLTNDVTMNVISDTHSTSISACEVWEVRVRV